MAAEVLPVDAQATHSKPRSTATERAEVMPVSLKEPVGFVPWCLARRQSMPAILAQRGRSYRGVLPSRRVTALSGFLRMGSRSRKRHTPLWSMARVEERRSCQSQRSALGLGRLESEPAARD